MISFSRISKQYGRQVLFVDASFQLNPGEKVGLVGPNGAGKTTLFRMIVGEESQDEGEVSVPKKLTIGYFRQDVEEMSGRSVLDEAIAGSGRVGDLHHELEDLTFSLPPTGIVGVIGPNGAGKTTLFRMITGAEQPDAGTLRIGEIGRAHV